MAFITFLLQLKAFPALYRSKKLNYCKSAYVGGLAPDASLADVSGKNKHLLSCMKSNRPLVLNFGSST